MAQQPIPELLKRFRPWYSLQSIPVGQFWQQSWSLLSVQALHTSCPTKDVIAKVIKGNKTLYLRKAEAKASAFLFGIIALIHYNYYEMKPINIYALTRVSSPESIEKLERQMSGRDRLLKVKEWEIDSLKAFSKRLNESMDEGFLLDFFYSFTMPKLGKEFDLLRINDDTVINIELKSGNVPDDLIRKQLLQNKYYISTLGKTMYFFTYVSNTDRLVRLSRSEKLVETSWEELVNVLKNQKDCYTGDIEDLFKEDKYLISPLSDPGRFLRQEYFLTSQQKDVKKQILKNVKKMKDAGDEVIVQGFTGLPGTGKTILLYDLAMQLSMYDEVCVFHFGSHEKELEQLDERLKRVDFYYCEANRAVETVKPYTAIFIDEGHRIDKDSLRTILEYARKWHAPIIISYDLEDVISADERQNYGAALIENLPGFIRYQLTNRIRLNSELSTFINSVMSAMHKFHRRPYPSVSVSYATDDNEAALLIKKYLEDGYIFIWDKSVYKYDTDRLEDHEQVIEASEATCKEFEKVLMYVDETFTYNQEGYIISTIGKDNLKDNDFRVRNLFHGLSRAKSRIALVVKNNEEVLNVLLSILQ